MHLTPIIFYTQIWPFLNAANSWAHPAFPGQMYLLEQDQLLPAIMRIRSQFKGPMMSCFCKALLSVSTKHDMFLSSACGREETWQSSRGSALCPPLVSLSTMCWELRRWPQRMILRDHTGEASPLQLKPMS